jgi:hypothetical protein
MKKSSLVTNTGDIQSVATSLGIGLWDAILIGDGSGTGWDRHGGGWACVLIDNRGKKRRVFSGGMDNSTVGISELMAYVHALLWFTANDGKTLRKEIGRPLSVHIITDSESTHTVGNALAKRQTTLDAVANSPLWAAVMDFDRKGFNLHWHWINRQTIALNKYCDELSRNQRLASEAVVKPLDPKTGRPYSLTDLNPHAVVARGRNLLGARRRDPVRKTN